MPSKRKVPEGQKEVRRTDEVREVREVRLVHLIAAQWDGNTGTNYTLFGLDSNGKVYRKDGRRTDWVPVSMTIQKDEKDDF